MNLQITILSSGVYLTSKTSPQMMISYRNQIREGGRSAGGLCTILQPLFQLWFSHVNPVTLTCVQLASYNHNCVVTHVLKAIMQPLLLKMTQIESQPIFFPFFLPNCIPLTILALNQEQFSGRKGYIVRRTSSESSTKREICFPSHLHPTF